MAGASDEVVDCPELGGVVIPLGGNLRPDWVSSIAIRVGGNVGLNWTFVGSINDIVVGTGG